MGCSRFARLLLCSSLLTPAAESVAQEYFQDFSLRRDIAQPSFDLSAFMGLPDEAFVREIRRLQSLHPGAAYPLAEEAMRHRPHLANVLSNPWAVEPRDIVAEPLREWAEPRDSDGQGLVMVGGGLALLGGVAAFLATSGGGEGGGSGGGGYTRNVTTTLPSVPPGWEEDAADWEDAEYDVDYSKSMINASSAYARAGTGDGIRVGLIDGGIDASHGQFAGKIGGCFNLQNGASGACVDPDDHGTHVAGSIAAARDGAMMSGVAFDAELYSIRAFASGVSGPWVGTDEHFEDSISWAANNDVAVINNSYGTIPHDQASASAIHAHVADTYGTGFDIARANDIVMVWATGNDDYSQPSVEAALPLYDPSLRDLWIAVTSVDGNGLLASYANACGAAAQWCIAAPGGELSPGAGIVSTVEGGGFAESAGTSMAAPQMTGAVAIMLQLFGPGTPSNLSPQEIVKILFVTADKNLPGFAANANGVSSTYGHGLLDLDAATTPGTHSLRFSTFSGSFASLTSSGIMSGPAYGGGISAALSGKTLAVFDELNRAVVIDLEHFAAQTSEPIDLERALANFGQGNGFKEVVTQDGLKFALRGSFNEEDGGFLLGGNGQARLAVELTGSTTLESGYNVDASQMIGMYATGQAAPELLIDPVALSSPYLALAESAMTTSLRRSASDSDLTLVGFGGTDYRPEETELDACLNGDEERNWTYGVAAEWTTRAADGFSLALRSGALIEADELLGTEMEGGFAVTQTETAFIGATVSYDLAAGLTAVAAYDIGLSAVSAEDSLFSGFGAVLSESFSLGLLGKGGLQESDRYGLIVSQPLRVSSSEAEMTLPQARNSDGSLTYSTEDVDLAPEDRELRIQGFYATDLGEGELSFGGLMRLNPGHDASAAAEWAALASYQSGF